MSFENIAKRFKEVGWNDLEARNTVERHLKDLVRNAEIVIREEIEKIEAKLIVIGRDPDGIRAHAKRAQRHIRNMITRSQMAKLFDRPNQIAEALGQYFLHLAKAQIPGDWTKMLDDDRWATVGYESFIEYVCDGRSSEQFLGERAHVPLDCEAIHSFVFLLDSWPPDQVKSDPTYKAKLERLVAFATDSTGFPKPALHNLKKCFDALDREEGCSATAMSYADEARIEIRKFWDWWNLRNLVHRRALSRLHDAIEDFPDQNPSRKKGRPSGKETTLRHLQKVSMAVDAPFDPTAAVYLRELLNQLVILLEQQCQPENVVPLKQEHFEKKIVTQVTSFAATLRERLQMKPPTPSRSAENLADLLQRLRPTEALRCRPYELFRFAAERQLLDKQLIRKRKLDPPFRPEPGVPFHERASILTTHRGAEIAAGITRPSRG